MPLITLINNNGDAWEAEAKSGQSLMRAAVDNGIDGILAECGGACSCGTCHCYIDAPWFDQLPPASDMENSMLEAVLEPQDNSRLSCQLEVTDAMEGMTVHLPASQY